MVKKKKIIEDSDKHYLNLTRITMSSQIQMYLFNLTISTSLIELDLQNKPHLL